MTSALTSARPTCLLILDGRLPPAGDAQTEMLDLQAFVALAYQGHWMRRLLAYREVRLLTYSARHLPRRFLLMLLLWCLARRRCVIESQDGQTLSVHWPALLAQAWHSLLDAWGRPGLLRRARQQVTLLAQPRPRATLAAVPARQAPWYLKTDLWLGTPAGGSITHVAGVVNHLADFGGSPILWAPTANPLVDRAVTFRPLALPDRYWDFRECPPLALNEWMVRHWQTPQEQPSWIYQRYSLHQYAGVWAARHFKVPLVLEYNGSEVWIGQHWGNGLRYPALAQEIEMLNLRQADLVVVVSAPLRAELEAIGVAPERILVNPNGVDPQVYSPQVDGMPLRRRLALENACVIGFIGTFGKWHGAQVLVEAFARVLEAWPSTGCGKPLHLLMIGDGQTQAQCRDLAVRFGIEASVHFPGTVPQKEGPQWLAACDLLVAPHVPNPDGSAFFGSPTKVFEYMAMQKPIVASRLGQIGEVLSHGVSARLVEPGSVASLAEGLLSVLADPEGAQEMARRARLEVLAHYTWQAHVGRILTALERLCA